MVRETRSSEKQRKLGPQDARARDADGGQPHPRGDAGKVKAQLESMRLSQQTWCRCNGEGPGPPFSDSGTPCNPSRD